MAEKKSGSKPIKVFRSQLETKKQRRRRELSNVRLVPSDGSAPTLKMKRPAGVRGKTVKKEVEERPFGTTQRLRARTNPDMAAVNVQNRVSMAQGLLPQEVTMIGVMTFKRQTSMLQINALVSDVPEYDQNFMSNYMNINVTPQLKRIQGVGEVQAMGANYSLRMWLKPEIMAMRSSFS